MVYWIVIIPSIVAFVLCIIRLIYRYKSGKFSINASLRDRVCIITGATSGIGYETALLLYSYDATVIMLARDIHKAHRCAAKMMQSAIGSHGRIDIIECDLASLDSVRHCADRIIASCPLIHVLINNAGQGGEPGTHRRVTVDGLERTMAANYFGHFLLTNLLYDRMQCTGSARVINVSSLIHTWCKRLPIDSLNFTDESYSAFDAYCRSKLAQILFARHMSTMVASKDIAIYSLNPGILATPISRYFIRDAFGETLARLIMPFAFFINTLVAKTTIEGAQTTLYLAVQDDIEHLSGGYFADCALTEPSLLAKDRQLAKSLWDKSIELVGLSTKL